MSMNTSSDIRREARSSAAHDREQVLCKAVAQRLEQQRQPHRTRQSTRFARVEIQYLAQRIFELDLRERHPQCRA